MPVFESKWANRKISVQFPHTKMEYDTSEMAYDPLRGDVVLWIRDTVPIARAIEKGKFVTEFRISLLLSYTFSFPKEGLPEEGLPGRLSGKEIYQKLEEEIKSWFKLKVNEFFGERIADLSVEFPPAYFTFRFGYGLHIRGYIRVIAQFLKPIPLKGFYKNLILFLDALREWETFIDDLVLKMIEERMTSLGYPPEKLVYWGRPSDLPPVFFETYPKEFWAVASDVIVVRKVILSPVDLPKENVYSVLEPLTETKDELDFLSQLIFILHYIPFRVRDARTNPYISPWSSYYTYYNRPKIETVEDVIRLLRDVYGVVSKFG